MCGCWDFEAFEWPDWYVKSIPAGEPGLSCRNWLACKWAPSLYQEPWDVKLHEINIRAGNVAQWAERLPSMYEVHATGSTQHRIN